MEKRKAQYIDDTLNLRIKSQIKECGLTVANFAKKINVATSSVHSWLGGYSRPDIDRIFDICRTLNCTADYLFGLSDSNTGNPDIVNASQLTGLSEKAVVAIMDICATKDINVLNNLFECEGFYVLLHLFDYYATVEIKSRGTGQIVSDNSEFISDDELTKSIISAHLINLSPIDGYPIDTFEIIRDIIMKKIDIVLQIVLTHLQDMAWAAIKESNPVPEQPTPDTKKKGR